MRQEYDNVVILDLETARSAEDCQHCGKSKETHGTGVAACHTPLFGLAVYKPIGWDNKVALGLSIGCYWDTRDSRMHWFDVHTLEAAMRYFVATQPLLVSFNGIAFDFPLMRALLRHRAEEGLEKAGPGIGEAAYQARHAAADQRERLELLCDTFQALCATSYDILAEIWKVDPSRKFERGLNSLDAISQANGLGAKEMTGAQAPLLWQQGRYAEVIGYCQGDVEKTKALFDLVCAGQPVLRGDGQPITLRNPLAEAGNDETS